jgi:predicted glutamine amidotransferase
MGFSFSHPIRANEVFYNFRLRDAKNPDGWGVAFFQDTSIQIFKEPIPATTSKLSEFLRDYEYFTTSILLAHVRKGSVGKRFHKNTHPYYRELFGKQYSMAHNGNLVSFKDKLLLGDYVPTGDTDSEYMFAFLLQKIKKRNLRLWNIEDFQWFRQLLLEVNELGMMNVLLSEGELLFVYHDKKDFTSIYYTEQNYKQKITKFIDLNIDFDATKYYPEKSFGYIVATKPLTDQTWNRMKPAQLLVFQEGKILFDSELSISEYKRTPIEQLEQW